MVAATIGSSTSAKTDLTWRTRFARNRYFASQTTVTITDQGFVGRQLNKIVLNPLLGYANTQERFQAFLNNRSDALNHILIGVNKTPIIGDPIQRGSYFRDLETFRLQVDRYDQQLYGLQNYQDETLSTVIKETASNLRKMILEKIFPAIKAKQNSLLV